MADTLTTTTTVSTVPNGTIIATDDAGVSGHVQIVKLARSTDGSATPITADADGMLVNLGTNNDVTVTGTVTANIAAGTNNIGDVDVLSIAAGDNNIGNVDIVTMPAVTNAGTFAVQESGGALTSLQLIDDTVYTDGTGTPSKAIGIAGTDGTNPQIIKTDASGELQVDVLTMPTTTVQGTVAVTQSGTWDEVGINDSGNSITVDAVSLPLPTGASTLAEQQTQTTALQLIDDTVATLGTTTYSESTTKGLIVGAVRRDADTTLADTTNEVTPLQVDASGRLKVEVFDGGDSHTVDNNGTFAVQAAQSGTWNVTNVSGTVSLPTGAATSAKQDTEITALQAIQTAAETLDNIVYVEDAAAAANPSGPVLMLIRDDAMNDTVSDDGDNMAARGSSKGELLVKDTDLQIYLSTLADTTFADDGAATAGDYNVMMAGARFNNSTPDSVDEGDAGSLRMSANRALFVNIRDNAGNERGLNIDGSGNLTANITGTVTVGSHAVTNTGTFATQVDGAALTALQKIDDPVLVDDAGFTPASSSVMMAGFEADEGSTDSVDEGDAGAARMTLDRKQIVTVQGHTAGGLSTFMASGSDGSSILVATAQAIKASAGQMYGYYAYNPEAAVTFVHFYNTAAASVTVGTTNPLFTIAIPAGAAANLNIAQGITFSNAGWSCAATTTAGGNTAPSTGVSLVVWYM